MAAMRLITASLLVGACAAATPALSEAQQGELPPARTSSATEALQFLLDVGITPAGPIRADGSTIASILAGESLTFPVSTSSGAFAVRRLRGFGPALEVSTSGNFGSAFAERGLTNGKGNVSASLTYQRLSWGSIGGIDLDSGDLILQRVQTVPMPTGPAGTADDISARISYTTDVLVVAASYGVLDRLDVGVALPYIHASVDGTKQRTLRQPGGATALEYSQGVTGSSHGPGDAIVRIKWRVPNPFNWADELSGDGNQVPVQVTTAPRRSVHRGTAVALGLDIRFPTGKTAILSLDCSSPPCGTNKASVPDLGLGTRTIRASMMVSTAFPRFSPHLNLSYFYVPPYNCDPNRFGQGGKCKGTVFEFDPTNGGQDAKNQNLTDELSAVLGADFEVIPYRTTISFDVLGRQLIRAGQMFYGPPRIIYRPSRPGQPLDEWASVDIETRHGNLNTLVSAIGMKVNLHARWVVATTVLLPLAGNGLKPKMAVVFGVERALGH